MAGSSIRCWNNGFYRYDPTNYHGPLHFYILFFSQSLFGRHIWALRLPVVLASIGSIFVTLKFEPFVGRKVSRIAALAMAISPGFIFYGRYSIHEVWLLLFSMLFVLGLLGLWRLRHARLSLVRRDRRCGNGADQGNLHHPYRERVDRGRRARGFRTGSRRCLRSSGPASNGISSISRSSRARPSFLIVFFYSGTFLNWPGVKGLYLTFATWYQTGSKGNGHEKPWPYWLELVMRYEWPVLIGLVLCLAVPVFRNFVIRYLAIYGVGSLRGIQHYSLQDTVDHHQHGLAAPLSFSPRARRRRRFRAPLFTWLGLP